MDFRHPLNNLHTVIGIDISPMPVRHGQTPARRLHLPESELPWQAGRSFVVRDWRSGVSAERRHLKKRTSLRRSADAPLRGHQVVFTGSSLAQ